jgi:membrane-bound serine protease (ClpP class)
MIMLHKIRIAALIAILSCSGMLRADIIKISINDTIHPITDEYIGRALAEAERTKAEAVLIELRTPGGLVDST